VAWFASRLTGLPFSYTTHAKDLYLTAPRSLRRRSRDARFIATCTGHNVDYLKSILPPQDHGKIRLVYHGVDLVRFAFRERSPRETGQAPLILSVGRLVPKKGHDDLIAACAILAGRGVDFRCAIVGGGPLHDELSGVIDRRGLSGIVSLEGAMAQTELIGLYRRADIFALAPRITANGDRDGIPNVLAEAMAMGVPVVSTELSGIPELVRHGYSGLLTHPASPGELADALERLLGDPDYARSLAINGRAELERAWNCDKTTQTLRDLMSACLCGAPENVSDPAGSFPAFQPSRAGLGG
jgi:glycosyltransferase involved in cell wall biosynthesis